MFAPKSTKTALEPRNNSECSIYTSNHNQRHLHSAPSSKSSAQSMDGLMNRRQRGNPTPPPPGNRYLAPGLRFEGKIFKEQQTKFVTSLVLPNLAQMLSAMQKTIN